MNAGDFVGVAIPTVIYVGIGDHAEFDKIARPATDLGEQPDGSHVIVKTVEQDGVRVIFQHWIKSPPLRKSSAINPAGAV